MYTYTHHICIHRPCGWDFYCLSGKRASIHRHPLEAISETATVLELRQRILYTTPSGWWWWWCLKSLFRVIPDSQKQRPESTHKSLKIDEQIYLGSKRVPDTHFSLCGGPGYPPPPKMTLAIQKVLSREKYV